MAHLVFKTTEAFARGPVGSIPTLFRHVFGAVGAQSHLKTGDAMSHLLDAISFVEIGDG